ncbi:hypothetical protein FGO68_gene1542 [Halteria grandinella]|uniref:Uncharacterized protein n=1 Tax=Halteria grandinella TaxID=5974 RepID=A0A8J8NKQ5_HALGN|nr:hypothetical protein FGO68_gene1542 [Halteria grandinella]
MELSLINIVAEIKAEIQSSDSTFDVALIVIKIFDFRASVQEVIALKAIKNFFELFSPKKVFCIITHCDCAAPDEETLTRKLDSFKKWGGFEVPRENVIYFKNTPESLQPLVEKLGGAQLNIQQSAAACPELIAFMNFMEQQNKDYLKMIEDQRKTMASLIMQRGFNRGA